MLAAVWRHDLWLTAPSTHTRNLCSTFGNNFSNLDRYLLLVLTENNDWCNSLSLAGIVLKKSWHPYGDDHDLRLKSLKQKFRLMLFCWLMLWWLHPSFIYSLLHSVLWYDSNIHKAWPGDDAKRKTEENIINNLPSGKHEFNGYQSSWLVSLKIPNAVLLIENEWNIGVWYFLCVQTSLSWVPKTWVNPGLYLKKCENNWNLI